MDTQSYDSIRVDRSSLDRQLCPVSGTLDVRIEVDLSLEKYWCLKQAV